MSTPRPTEADVETAARAMHERQEYTTYWDDEQRAGTRMRELGEQGREFYRGLATVALSAVSTARAAEHQREVEALRASKAEVHRELERWEALAYGNGWQYDQAEARAEAAERDRDEARRELADLRAKVAETRAGIWRLGESIHGDEGVEHVEGCEGEPTCFACILADLRALLPTEDDQP